MRPTTGAPAPRAVRRAVLAADPEAATDGQLLGAFVAGADGAAFGALVYRHGPMVLGVCRRVLAHREDAEDAFQATFLVLARRAGAVGDPERLGNWLYGVARRVAAEARRRRARARARERQVDEMPEHPATSDRSAWDLAPVLDDELARLPEKHRLPVILCDLEGRTRRAVARQLRIPEGTLSNRLAAARLALARRLTRRGITLLAGAVAVVLVEARLGAAVPESLAEAATGLAAGRAAPGAVVTLTEGVLKAMLLTRLKIAAVVLFVALGGIGLGAARPGAEARQPPGPEDARKGERPPAPAGAKGGWAAVRTLEGHTDAVQCLAFGPGDVLVSAGRDGQVKVWDVGPGREVGSLRDPGLTNITDVTYAADGSWVAYRSPYAVAV
ncbi:MAG TPA: sigma-70 family RNA polymerase sigma factor, partial [Urbifossiella sp.]|nr:sigma-70 family RNA polymerase sigma factor [Urbifossiella sp.]